MSTWMPPATSMLGASEPLGARPPTTVCQPYALVRHNGELRLAWITSFFGGGIPIGPFLGGRGHILLDSGMWTDESETQVVFKAVDFVYEWERRPSNSQLEKAKARELLAA